MVFIISSCSSPYDEHFWREHIELATPSPIISGEVFLSDGQIESLPNSHTQSDLIHQIDSARHRVWIEIYTWTDAAKLTDPIIRAKAR